MRDYTIHVPKVSPATLKRLGDMNRRIIAAFREFGRLMRGTAWRFNNGAGIWGLLIGARLAVGGPVRP